MFVVLSKTLAKFGSFRLGIRTTKKNAPYILLVMLFVWMFQMVLYMILFCGWLIYAACYGCVWCIKKLFGKFKGK